MTTLSNRKFHKGNFSCMTYWYYHKPKNFPVKRKYPYFQETLTLLILAIQWQTKWVLFVCCNVVVHLDRFGCLVQLVQTCLSGNGWRWNKQWALSQCGTKLWRGSIHTCRSRSVWCGTKKVMCSMYTPTSKVLLCGTNEWYWFNVYFYALCLACSVVQRIGTGSTYTSVSKLLQFGSKEWYGFNVYL